MKTLIQSPLCFTNLLKTRKTWKIIKKEQMLYKLLMGKSQLKRGLFIMRYRKNYKPLGVMLRRKGVRMTMSALSLSIRATNSKTNQFMRKIYQNLLPNTKLKA
jgi:hypothetical protein